MPAPAVVGIPWLAALIGSLFGSIVEFFAKRVTKRIAIVAAAVTVMAGITAALYVAVGAVLSGISAQLPAGALTAAGMFLPSNSKACVAAVMTVYVLRWTYDWNTKVLQWKLF